MLQMIKRLPQPTRTLYVLFLLAFVGTFLSFLLVESSVGFGILGVVASLLGLSLMINLRGAADALALSAKEMPMMGIDYSKSFFAKAWFARVYGGGIFLIGVVFAVTSFAPISG